MKQTKRILIMGLPGAGKTYFAERLKTYLETHGERPLGTIEADTYKPQMNARVDWFNADEIRKKYNKTRIYWIRLDR